VETWTLVDVHADIQLDGDRWLLVYNVPTEYAPDGTYSVSYPADMVNHWAVTYGYDLDDPAGVDELFDHLLLAPYMAEVARREGRAYELASNPYEMAATSARELARDQVAEFKQAHAIESESAPAAMKASGRTDGGKTGGTLLDTVRADMLARVDRAVIDEGRALADIEREHAQERMIDMAYRMNAVRRSGDE